MSYFDQKLQARETSLGAFSVRRALPKRDRRTIGPFIFFDHMGPAVLPPDVSVDVRPHPHIGLATVTYLFEGEFYHRDSLGNEQRIVPGEMNWMTAGKGIVHSERSPNDLEGKEKPLHGLQLWVALPKEAEDMDPAFFHHDRSEMPEWTDDGGIKYHLLLGSAFGKTSPVKTFSETLYLSIEMPKGTQINLPQDLAHEIGVYLLDGQVKFCDEDLPKFEIGYKEMNGNVTVEALEPSKFVIIGGAPFPEERFIWWNFVSSSKEKIEAAKERWRNQDYPPVPNETEFIPLPET